MKYTLFQAVEIHSSDAGEHSYRHRNYTWRDIMHLTPHFTLEEMTRSDTATRLGICNEPGIDAISNLQRLCQSILEPLREHAGQPVHISSGFRCRALNRAVGGVPNSMHIYGKAADIAMPRCDASGHRLTHAEAKAKLREWYEWIKEHCKYKELVWEETWVHVAR